MLHKSSFFLRIDAGIASSRDEEMQQDFLEHPQLCTILLEVLSSTSSEVSIEATKSTLKRLLTLSKPSSVNKMSSVNRSELCQCDMVSVILDNYADVLKGNKYQNSGKKDRFEPFSPQNSASAICWICTVARISSSASIWCICAVHWHEITIRRYCQWNVIDCRPVRNVSVIQSTHTVLHRWRRSLIHPTSRSSELCLRFWLSTGLLDMLDSLHVIVTLLFILVVLDNWMNFEFIHWVPNIACTVECTTSEF